MLPPDEIGQSRNEQLMPTMSTRKLDVDAVTAQLEKMSAQQILHWALGAFPGRFAVQSSMQKTGTVLMHMIGQIAPDTEIIFIDTGVHFRETLEIRDEFQRKYGLNIQTYAAEKTFEEQYTEFGRYLHETDDTKPGAAPGYQHCCFLRKEVPFVNAVRGRFDLIAGGLMRSEGGNRANTPVLSWDDRIDAYKVYPLAQWTDDMVDDYIREHNLPVHPLYARGYASIGCFTCTTPIKEGEDRRAGRWRHIREANPDLQAQPIYCGINFEDRKK